MQERMQKTHDGGKMNSKSHMFLMKKTIFKICNKKGFSIYAPAFFSSSPRAGAGVGPKHILNILMTIM